LTTLMFGIDVDEPPRFQPTEKHSGATLGGIRVS
jgi:hypothetical protein